MKVYKSVYTDPKSGRARKTGAYYVRFRDHEGILRRTPALTSKAASEEFGRRIEQLVAFRIAGGNYDAATIRWVETLPPKVRARLVRFGLLDARLAAAGKTLAEHVADFERSLSAKENTPAYVKLTVSRVRRIVDGCGFTHWSDVSASKVEAYLAGLRADGNDDGKGRRGISIQSSNFYLAAFKNFARWMCKDRRAADPVVGHLEGLNVATDRRHDRRALSVEEVIELLNTTATGPVRGRVAGEERALLYQFAAETGMRAGEIRSLHVGDFDLDAKPPFVRLAAAASKNRRAATLVLRAGMAGLLQTHFANKLPTAAAFRMPGRTHLARVVRADLDAARDAWLGRVHDPKVKSELEATDFLAYKSGEGTYADFHGFRHVTGSFLARAGVNPKTAQAILRHSDYRLTMNLYSHAYRQDEAEAVERLPDLSRRAAGGGGPVAQNSA